MKLHLKYSIVAAVIGLLLALFLVEIKGILLPFVLAFVLAYLLNPIVNKLERKISRPFSAGMVVALALFLFILVVLLLIPLAQAQISDFIGRVPLMAEKIWGYLKKLIVWGRPQISYQQLYQLSDSTTQTAVGVLNGLGAGLNHIISGGLVVVNLLALLLVSPIVLFYVLKDLPQMKEKSKNLVPERFRPTFKEFLSVDFYLFGYLLRNCVGFHGNQFRGDCWYFNRNFVFYSLCWFLYRIGYFGIVSFGRGSHLNPMGCFMCYLFNREYIGRLCFDASFSRQKSRASSFMDFVRRISRRMFVRLFGGIDCSSCGGYDWCCSQMAE